jgi:hypothetical protein
MSVALLCIVIIVPLPHLVCPDWEVSVVDQDGNPLKGMTVRLSYQDYSLESVSHDEDRVTDSRGHVSFVAKTTTASVGSRALGALRSAIRTGVHASFGRHAWVFAFGNGLEGSAETGNYVTDWNGSPRLMRSRIVSRPMISSPNLAR